MQIRPKSSPHHQAWQLVRSSWGDCNVRFWLNKFCISKSSTWVCLSRGHCCRRLSCGSFRCCFGNWSAAVVILKRCFYVLFSEQKYVSVLYLMAESRTLKFSLLREIVDAWMEIWGTLQSLGTSNSLILGWIWRDADSWGDRRKVLHFINLWLLFLTGNAVLNIVWKWLKNPS